MMAGKVGEATAAVEALDLGVLLAGIRDEGVRNAVVRLTNLLEQLAAEVRSLLEANQRLQDENNRLKGQSPRPTGKGGKGGKGAGKGQDYSSEKERQTPKTWSKGSKIDQIIIDREQKVPVDRALLPADAVFKGYVPVVVQDVKVTTDNVRFLKEKWYSASEGRTYLADLPAGYAGEFGPGVGTLVPVLYFGLGTSEPKIVEFLRYVGVSISDGQVSDMLIKDQEPFHEDAAAVREAGLGSSPWQHLDTTATRVNGEAQHCHVLANPLYSGYDTRPAKDRLTVIDVLRGGQDRRFVLNDEAMGYLARMGLSLKRRNEVGQLPWHEPMDMATLEQQLGEKVPSLGPTQRRWVLDALAVAAYHAQTDYPVVRMLVCDDAPAFNWVTDDLALCWIHEGRHYAKLGAVLRLHCELLDDFGTRFWAYYRALAAYREAPSEADRQRLETEFEVLFTTETDFWPLNERIALTYAKKEQLLAVLAHPEVPLHNNPAELAVRRRVRKRDVSFGPRTAEGAKAWDTFQTLAATAQKLNVSFFRYIQDRVSGAHQMPSLADLIRQRASVLDLGASWTVT